MERGADHTKGTLCFPDPVCVALSYGDGPIIELFLNKKKFQINQKWDNGVTALHLASGISEPEILKFLLSRGADVNIMDDNGETPLTKTISTVKNEDNTLIKHLAKLKLENKFICEKNLDCLFKRRESWKMLTNFFDELQRMKNIKFYNDISFYDVLEMKKNPKKLILLCKNKDFEKGFMSHRRIHITPNNSFPNFGHEMDAIFLHYYYKSYVFQRKEKKLISILKNHLPELAISRIAYYANKHLFL